LSQILGGLFLRNTATISFAESFSAGQARYIQIAHRLCVYQTKAMQVQNPLKAAGESGGRQHPAAY